MPPFLDFTKRWLPFFPTGLTSMLSSSAVLGMLIYETSGLYCKLTDAHVKLLESSARDGLTGVFNRAYFDERYGHEHTLAASSGYSLCVLLIDVDNFKAYNDTFGHLAGDDCLRKVAQALTGTLTRKGDFVARYGGEEFVVVLPACEAAAGLAVAEKLRAAVEKAALPSPRSGAVVTISVGHACRDAASRQTAKALLESADAALYAAKAGGRNRVASARLDKSSGGLVRQTSAS